MVSVNSRSLCLSELSFEDAARLLSVPMPAVKIHLCRDETAPPLPGFLPWQVEAEKDGRRVGGSIATLGSPLLFCPARFFGEGNGYGSA